ncbi:MAG: hypothetical protein ACRD0A_20850, partial [Acidimicrobiales bacterium]
VPYVVGLGSEEAVAAVAAAGLVARSFGTAGPGRVVSQWSAGGTPGRTRLDRDPGRPPVTGRALGSAAIRRAQ